MSKSQLIAKRFAIHDPEKDLLGRGGMGDVYRATDLQTNGLVAVKALNPQAVGRDPELLERFMREGQALRQLNHPNIVRMVAAVEEAGQHYLALEYVEGGSLADLLAEDGTARLPAERVLEIALDLADALTRAHRLGIIHRDLKPANVLLAGDGTPRLTDFGIAHLSADPPITQTGYMMGTVDYISPELCEGQPASEQSDIWAFGVLLFEMLTGQLPFKGESLTARLTAILTQPVPDMTALVPGIPDALADLTYRMLEKDPQQRIPSVRQVGLELEALLKGRVSSPVKSRFSLPATAGGGPKHNLPLQTTPFVGRQAELGELSRLLANPTVRLLTILGAGGMGKTRLALEVGQAELDHFPQGVYFVPLASLQTIGAIVPAVAQAVGCSFLSGMEPRQQLLDYLQPKCMLLIMDNFEHLLDGAGMMSEMLAAAPKLKILVTSRLKLNLQTEQFFQLGGLDFPDWKTPQEAFESSALKLFLQGARRVRPLFELAEEDLKVATHICRLVEGMPLGILLAATWVEMLSLPEIAGEITRSLDFLETDLQDIPERQRSLRAVFDHSWDLLPERERVMFRGLSVFRGGFKLEAAQQVTGISLRELISLVNKSLLQRDPGGRYSIHELLRQYAAEKLEQASEEARAVKNLHCAYFSDFLHVRYAGLVGKYQKQALGEIGEEIENVRAAWTHAVDRGRLEEIERSLECLAEFYRTRAWSQEGEDVFARAAAKLQDVCDQVLKEKLSETGKKGIRVFFAKLLLWQGFFELNLGLLKNASKLLQTSLDIFREAGAYRESAYALLFLAGTVPAWEETKAFSQKAQAIFEKIGDRRGVALSLRALGPEAYHLGDYDQTIQIFQQRLALFRELENQQGIAESLNSLGLFYYFMGKNEEAKKLTQESLDLFTEIGDRYGIAMALHISGYASAGMKNYAECKRLFQERLAISKEIGDLPGIAVVFTDLASLALGQGEYQQAFQFAQESYPFYKRMNEQMPFYDYYRVMGEAVLGLGDLQEAKYNLVRSLEISKSMGSGYDTLYPLIGIARLLSAWGEKEKALEILSMIIHHPAIWQWGKNGATAAFTEIGAGLPGEKVEAAWMRGQALHLAETVDDLLVELKARTGQE